MKFRSPILNHLKGKVREDFPHWCHTLYPGGFPKVCHVSLAAPVQSLELIQNAPRRYRSTLMVEFSFITPGSLEGPLDELCSWVEKQGFSVPNTLNFEIHRVESAEDVMENKPVSMGKVSVLFLTEGEP